MGLLDLFKKDQELCLQVIHLEKWPQKLIKQQKLDLEIKKFLKRIDQKKRSLNEAKAKLTNPNINVPNRAKEMFDEHSQLIVQELDNLIEKSNFIDDIFLINEQKEDFGTMIVIFRDLTRKSFSTLKEFVNSELLQITRALNELEDEVINLNQLFEKTKFENIIKIKQSIDDYRKTRGKSSLIENKKRELETRIEHLENKKLKINSKIKEYLENAKGNSKAILEQEKKLLEDIRAIEEGIDHGDIKILKEELKELKRKMINDITAMNINEQKRFLQGVEEDLKTLKTQINKIKTEYNNLSLDNTVSEIKNYLEGFKVRFEDGSIKDILK